MVMQEICYLWIHAERSTLNEIGWKGKRREKAPNCPG